MVCKLAFVLSDVKYNLIFLGCCKQYLSLASSPDVGRHCKLVLETDYNHSLFRLLKEDGGYFAKQVPHSTVLAQSVGPARSEWVADVTSASSEDPVIVGGSSDRRWIQSQSTVLPLPEDLSLVRADVLTYSSSHWRCAHLQPSTIMLYVPTKVRLYSGGRAHYGGWTDKSVEGNW